MKVLELKECKWVNVKFVELYAPSLCTFTSKTPDEWEDKNDFDYSIKLIGAKISELITGGGYPENIIMDGSTVSSANLEYMLDNSPSLGECGLQVRKLLRGISNVKYLSIWELLQAIGATKLGLPLPSFIELKELRLNLPFDSEGLIELLHAAPFLKFLDISLEGWKDCYDYDSVDPLPYCVVNHLEGVNFHYFWLEPKYHVEVFLLKNGAHLKNVFISSYHELTDNTIFEKLSTFPKASLSLKIVNPLTV